MRKYTFTIALVLMIFSSGAKAQYSQVLDYLYTISGEQILSGQHNKEPNAEPSKWTHTIKAITDKYPAFWSGDFLFQQDNIDHRWPMAIGECAKLPKEKLLAAQPRWIYFMPWAELVKSANTNEEIQAVYNNPRVITRDEMPGWK